MCVQGRIRNECKCRAAEIAANDDDNDHSADDHSPTNFVINLDDKGRMVHLP